VAAEAFEQAKRTGNSGMIGSALLLSHEDQYYSYSLHILNGYLFLFEQGSEDPKVVTYLLDNVYVVSSETYRRR